MSGYSLKSGMEILAADHVVGSVMDPMEKNGWLVGGLLVGGQHCTML